MSPWVTLLIAVIVIIVIAAAVKYSKEGLGTSADTSNMLFGVIPAAPYIPPPKRTY